MASKAKKAQAPDFAARWGALAVTAAAAGHEVRLVAIAGTLPPEGRMAEVLPVEDPYPVDLPTAMLRLEEYLARPDVQALGRAQTAAELAAKRVEQATADLAYASHLKRMAEARVGRLAETLKNPPQPDSPTDKLPLEA